MSLLNAIKPILNSKTAKVGLEISAHPKNEGELVVVVKPVMGPVADNAPNELKQLVAALSSYLKAVGTPETIESELYAVVAEQAPQRNKWADRAAEMEAMIAQAAIADSSKAAAKKPTPVKPAALAAEEPIKDPLPLAGQAKSSPTSAGAAVASPATNTADDSLTFDI